MQDIEDKMIEFKTEIVFKGNVKELKNIVKTLEDLKVIVGIKPPFPPWPGLMPIKPNVLLSWSKIQELIKDRPVVVLKDIYGGIRDPHFHVDGGIVFLEKPEFKQFMGDVAGKLAEQIAEKGNYIESMETLQGMVEGGIITDY